LLKFLLAVVLAKDGGKDGRCDCVYGDRAFTHYMRSLGVPKDQCLEFTRRQAKLAALSRGTCSITERQRMPVNIHLYMFPSNWVVWMS